jgi:hypothetical protein
MPRKQLTEQLSRVLPTDDASIPDHITLVNVGDPQGSLLATRLQERQQKVISTLGPADIRAAVTCLVSKIQKLWVASLVLSRQIQGRMFLLLLLKPSVHEKIDLNSLWQYREMFRQHNHEASLCTVGQPHVAFTSAVWDIFISSAPCLCQYESFPGKYAWYKQSYWGTRPQSYWNIGGP